MNIICWNVNGLRALHRKGNFAWLIEKSPDIFCLQEVKAHPDQLPDEVRNAPEYQTFFDHSKVKKGYSGVAIYVKKSLGVPLRVDYGMGIEEFDLEGRLLGVHFKDFVLINIYFPNGGGGPVRLDYKLRFYDEFLSYIEKIKKSGKKVIFCGDVNTAHEAIDLARPKENEKNTGFLPEERAWIDTVIDHGYVDVFRQLNPGKKDAYTYWDQKTAARERNVGWRIDYFFCSSDMMPRVQAIKIHENVLGSDHCPIELVLKDK